MRIKSTNVYIFPYLSQSFKLDFLLRQEWNDHRLRHNHPSVLDGSNLVMGVWLPDSYFVQAKAGLFSKVAQDGQTVKVQNNGDVSHGTRYIIFLIIAISKFYLSVRGEYLY